MSTSAVCFNQQFLLDDDDGGTVFPKNNKRHTSSLCRSIYLFLNRQISTSTMRFTLSLLYAGSALAFAPVPFRASNNQRVCSSSSSELASSFAKDFMARANEAAGIETEDEEEVQLFSEELLDDMQLCLLTLEKRVKEGAWSLSHEEVDSFAIASARILKDMKDQSTDLEDRFKPGDRQKKAEAAALEAANAASAAGKSEDEIEAAAKAAFDGAQKAMIPPPKDDATAPEATTTLLKPEDTTVPLLLDENGEPITDTSEDEGPKFTGRMGVPVGTKNTYVLEGMDEMTADEYQKALEQAVMDRAKARRKSGQHGNRGTWDYLRHLQGGEEVDILSKKDGFTHTGVEDLD